ncbi:MAG TPA: hypothetical protein VMU51_04400 [Mycobacteriales bacterium]|nr:hypothetical protein [Mycobacteriales bacterium]
MREPISRGGTSGGHNAGNPSGRPGSERRAARGPGLEKVTVNLTSRSVEALENTVAETGESKTDVINKALQLYAFIQAHIDAGGLLYVRDPGTAELERLRIL